MQQSFETRKVTFTVFNRKEISKAKVNGFIEKYKKFDHRDVDKAFFNEMSPATDTTRGHFSRFTPATPMIYKGYLDDESLNAIGTLNKRPLVDVVDEVIALNEGSSANGSINLKLIDWSEKEAMDEEARLIAEIKAAEAELEQQEAELDANEKLIPIEAKPVEVKQSLTVKK